MREVVDLRGAMKCYTITIIFAACMMMSQCSALDESTLIEEDMEVLSDVRVHIMPLKAARVHQMGGSGHHLLQLRNSDHVAPMANFMNTVFYGIPSHVLWPPPSSVSHRCAICSSNQDWHPCQGLQSGCRFWFLHHMVTKKCSAARATSILCLEVTMNAGYQTMLARAWLVQTTTGSHHTILRLAR